MAKKTTTTQPVSASYDTPIIESEEKILEEVIKPHVEDHLKKQIEALRAKGFDNNRIAANLMIHKHIVDSL